MSPHSISDLIGLVSGPILGFASAFWMHRHLYAKLLRALASALDAAPGSQVASNAFAVAVDLGIPGSVARTLVDSLPPAVQDAERLLAAAKAAKAKG